MNIFAFDLTQHAPRSPRSKLGGYVLLPRMLDKGRATIEGKNGEYHFACPLDKRILGFLGLESSVLLEELKTGKGDGEILAWIQENQKNKREPWEIENWSHFQERRAPESDQDTATYFIGEVGKISPTREDIKTWFDLLDLDDYVTFGGKA